ncbi:MAG: sigma 54-interacting transcriptional regulator [Pseudohongiellaceae bacterium]
MKPRSQAVRKRLLLVDDDADLLTLISMRLKSNGYDVVAVSSGEKALAQLAVFRPHVVVTDQRMPGMDGMALFEEVQRRQPRLPVILLTAHGTIPDAVEATRRGVFSYLVKPFDAAILLDSIEKAFQQVGHVAESGTSRIDDSWRSEIISQSAAMESLLEQAHAAAVTDVSVLIQSQTGTGKELLARAIHKASPRAAGPFVAFNCAAIPESLIESELFGHAVGAFTGATRAHPGLFLAANKGSVFLDEVGDMPLAAQAKLLRVLESHEVRPVGTTDNLPIDVRIIAATHHDLLEKIAQGTFREDLYYRLNVITLELPTLAERREDIMLLAHHFCRILAEKNRKPLGHFAPEAVELLIAAAWPGNVRQLYNVVEQCMVLSPTPVIGRSLVARALRQKPERLLSLNEARDQFERDYLIRLLNLTEGNIALAARLAERNRSEFYNLLGRHGLDPEQFRRLSEANA